MILLTLPFLLSVSGGCRSPEIARFTVGPVLLREKATLDCFCNNCTDELFDLIRFRITWAIDRMDIRNDPKLRASVQVANRGQSLVLTNQSIPGQYTCRIDGPCGFVQIPPILVFAARVSRRMENEIIYRREGDPLTIDCSGELVNAPTKVKYRVDKIGLLRGGSRVVRVDGGLVFAHLTQVDTGVYRCRAVITDSESSWSFDTELFALYVAVADYGPSPPQIAYPPRGVHSIPVSPGEESCAFHGNPSPEITYYDAKKKRIDISSFRCNDLYFCNGKNAVGSAWGTFQAKRVGPPRGAILPRTERVAEGETKAFHFGSVCQDELTVSWYIGDRLIPSRDYDGLSHLPENGSVLIRFNLTEGPFKISCLVENDFGLYWAEHSLLVVPRKASPPRESKQDSMKLKMSLISIFSCIFVLVIPLKLYLTRRRRNGEIMKVKKILRNEERMTGMGEIAGEVKHADVALNNSIYI